MDDCPLVRLAYGRKIVKQFETTGKVAIHLNDWIRFFEALAFVNREGGHREIFCAIVGDYMVLSKTPLKRKPAPKQRMPLLTPLHTCRIQTRNAGFVDMGIALKCGGSIEPEPRSGLTYCKASTLIAVGAPKNRPPYIRNHNLLLVLKVLR
jgi:hypothetical protein